MTAIATSDSIEPLRIAIARTPAGRTFTVETFDTPDRIEPLWRDLQDNGLSSPYQRFDWIQAYVESCAAAEGFSPRILVFRDGAGRAVLLLPLAVKRQGGLCVARLIGGKQANFGLPVWASETAPNPLELRALLRDVGARQLCLDAYLFANLPRSWRGFANPLADGGRPSPSDGYRLALDADPQATLKRAYGADARKKLRSKERKLAELGEVRHIVASDPGEVERILQAFLDQKQERFEQLRIANPFADPATREFLRAGCLAGLARGAPAIELHALAAGERIVATFGGAVDRARFCGMFTSFDTAPEAARSSPSELLLMRVIEAQCREGRTTFDLGVGEAAYKDSVCDAVEPLVDVTLGVSARGRLLALAANGLSRAKRFVKRTPWAWTLAQRARGLASRR